MAGPIRFNSDDQILFVNGSPVAHFIEGTIQPDTGSKLSPIETAEGIVGTNVAPSARSLPGSGSFRFKGTSPDGFRIARASGNGEDVSIMIRVVKNKDAYPYSEIHLTNAILGPVPLGPSLEARDVEVSFSGTGYNITPRVA